MTEFFVNFGWDVIIFSPAGLETGIENKINLEQYTLENPFIVEEKTKEIKKKLLGKFW